ncbi:serine-rich adhesin for platelets-like [Periplaneta americana]|uniref:serine-rich adhesin for platelets-like n=1 Tax=Periplaneta americana TaxID=6978 RepID=UPI0037E8DDAB
MARQIHNFGNGRNKTDRPKINCSYNKTSMKRMKLSDKVSEVIAISDSDGDDDIQCLGIPVKVVPLVTITDDDLLDEKKVNRDDPEIKHVKTDCNAAKNANRTSHISSNSAEKYQIEHKEKSGSLIDYRRLKRKSVLSEGDNTTHTAHRANVLPISRLEKSEVASHNIHKNSRQFSRQDGVNKEASISKELKLKNECPSSHEDENITNSGNLIQCRSTVVEKIEDAKEEKKKAENANSGNVTHCRSTVEERIEGAEEPGKTATSNSESVTYCKSTIVNRMETEKQDKSIVMSGRTTIKYLTSTQTHSSKVLKEFQTSYSNFHQLSLPEREKLHENKSDKKQKCKPGLSAVLTKLNRLLNTNCYQETGSNSWDKNTKIAQTQVPKKRDGTLLLKVPASSSEEKVILKTPASSSEEKVILKAPAYSSEGKVILKTPASSSEEKVILKAPAYSSEGKVIFKVPTFSSEEKIIQNTSVSLVASGNEEEKDNGKKVSKKTHVKNLPQVSKYVSEDEVRKLKARKKVRVIQVNKHKQLPKPLAQLLTSVLEANKGKDIEGSTLQITSCKPAGVNVNKKGEIVLYGDSETTHTDFQSRNENCTGKKSNSTLLLAGDINHDNRTTQISQIVTAEESNNTLLSQIVTGRTGNIISNGGEITSAPKKICVSLLTKNSENAATDMRDNINGDDNGVEIGVPENPCRSYLPRTTRRLSEDVIVSKVPEKDQSSLQPQDSSSTTKHDSVDDVVFIELRQRRYGSPSASRSQPFNSGQSQVVAVMPEKMTISESDSKVAYVVPLLRLPIQKRIIYFSPKYVTAFLEKVKTVFDIERYIRAIPDPFQYFKREKNNEINYNDHCLALMYLKSRYRRILFSDIEYVFERNKNNLTLTCEELDLGKSPLRKGNRKLGTGCGCNRPHELSMSFIHEVSFIEHKREIENYLREKQKKKELQYDMAKFKGELEQCGHCGVSGFILDEMATCGMLHLFCKSCIQNAVETRLSRCENPFACLDNECKWLINVESFKKAVKPMTFSALLHIRHLKEMQMAGVKLLETCPFCGFADIPKETDQLFCCLNVECMRDTCRKCKGPSHLPTPCGLPQKPQLEMPQPQPEVVRYNPSTIENQSTEVQRVRRTRSPNFENQRLYYPPVEQSLQSDIPPLLSLRPFGEPPQNFTPPPQNFTPLPQRFTPPPQNFTPLPQRFTPPPQNFTPQPMGFYPPEEHQFQQQYQQPQQYYPPEQYCSSQQYQQPQQYYPPQYQPLVQQYQPPVWTSHGYR